MGGFGPFIAMGAVANPVVIAVSIVVGWVARRWWHVALALLLAPVGYWVFYSTFYDTDHFQTLLPFIGIAGLIWSAATFAVKKPSQAKVGNG